MKYAIISDVHGNLEAFQTVLKAIKKEKVDKYLFAGDIVGYGANPSECIKELKKLDCVSVAGNHDWAVVELTPIENFNPYAKEAVKWTSEKLSKKDQDFLKSLPLINKIDNVTLVHATLQTPEKWNYIRSTFQAHKSMEIQETPVAFVGHSHVPISFFEPSEVKGPIRFMEEEKIQIQDGYKYTVNVGSTGQPRDGNPKAAYAIYDKTNKFVEIKRIEYDVKKAQGKIIEAGLPQVLADRLQFGE